MESSHCVHLLEQGRTHLPWGVWTFHWQEGNKHVPWPLTSSPYFCFCMDWWVFSVSALSYPHVAIFYPNNGKRKYSDSNYSRKVGKLKKMLNFSMHCPPCRSLPFLVLVLLLLSFCLFWERVLHIMQFRLAWGTRSLGPCQHTWWLFSSALFQYSLGYTELTFILDKQWEVSESAFSSQPPAIQQKLMPQIIYLCVFRRLGTAFLTSCVNCLHNVWQDEAVALSRIQQDSDLLGFHTSTIDLKIRSCRHTTHFCFLYT